MATSGTYAFTMTARQVITFAMRKLRLIDAVENASATDMETCRIELNVLLRGWQLSGPNLWRVTNGSLTLTANTAAFVLDTVPWEITNASFRSNVRDIPMMLLTEEEYSDLPLKTATGIPTQYYYDRQRDSGTLYVWPVMAAVAGETIEYTYQRRFQDVATLDENIDIPTEYLGTIAYALAAEIAPTFGVDARDVTRMADEMKAIARSADREMVVRFEPERR
jgi:hypothetical protein